MGVYCVNTVCYCNLYPFLLQLKHILGMLCIKQKSSHEQSVTGYIFGFYFPNKTSLYLIFSYFSVIHSIFRGPTDGVFYFFKYGCTFYICRTFSNDIGWLGELGLAEPLPPIRKHFFFIKGKNLQKY